MLSRANSQVLQWVMRDEGNALASEDLLETVDVEDMNRDVGKVWRIVSTHSWIEMVYIVNMDSIWYGWCW